jgi:hypothetical protein
MDTEVFQLELSSPDKDLATAIDHGPGGQSFAKIHERSAREPTTWNLAVTRSVHIDRV